MQYKDYVIKENDNLTSIAKENGTTVDALVRANNIKNPNYILTGDTIKIPSAVAEEPALSVGSEGQSSAPIVKAETGEVLPSGDTKIAVDDLAYKSYANGHPISTVAEMYAVESGGITPAKMVNRSKINDGAWQAYEKQRRQDAKVAADNALSAYSQNTGGVANSYAVSAAANASGQILSTLPQERMAFEQQQLENQRQARSDQLAIQQSIIDNTRTDFEYKLNIANQKAQFGDYSEVAALLGIPEEKVKAAYEAAASSAASGSSTGASRSASYSNVASMVKDMGDTDAYNYLSNMVKYGYITQYEANQLFDINNFKHENVEGYNPSVGGVVSSLDDIKIYYPEGKISSKSLYDTYAKQYGEDALKAKGISLGLSEDELNVIKTNNGGSLELDDVYYSILAEQYGDGETEEEIRASGEAVLNASGIIKK